MHQRIPLLAALAVTLHCPAIAQVAILQIRIIEGEGAVHAPGSHGVRPISVEVTDETGRPVADAAVSFHLPEDGPGGAFLNGLRTEVAVTDARGRVSLHGLQLNKISGRFQIRIVAVKEQARAGIIASQYIAEPNSGAASARPVQSPPSAADPSARGRAKWIVIAAAIGGGAAAGMLSATRRGATTAAPTSAPPITAPAGISIGAPSTTVGRP